MSQNDANSGQQNTENLNADASSENSVNQTIENLKAEVEKYKNDFLYLRAEFDTYRRNAIKERSDMAKYGAERLVNELLTVVDNFDRALETKPSPENIASYAKGVEMTSNELRSVLQKFGVTEVPSLGKPFDPAVHEALSAEASDAEPGSVVRVLRKPYRLHDRLVRPGQVIVAKGPEGKGV